MWNPFRKKNKEIDWEADLLSKFWDPEVIKDLMSHSPRMRSEALEVTWKDQMDPMDIPIWLMSRLIITNDGFPWFVKRNGQVQRVKTGQTFKHCRGDIRIYED